MKSITFLICFLFCCFVCLAQKPSKFSVGAVYGFGKNNNKDYTYSNEIYKLQCFYHFRKGGFFDYDFLIQPEVNFAKHQLINFYYVKETEPNFEQKRAEYTKLKNINEYVLNFGFVIRKNISKSINVFAVGSVGPMITDTETERLPKGFAFCDVFAMGICYKKNGFQLEIKPNLRHTSNAGLGSYNSGINTKNIEFGVAFDL
jgi:hypothetical protein